MANKRLVQAVALVVAMAIVAPEALVQSAAAQSPGTMGPGAWQGMGPGMMGGGGPGMMGPGGQGGPGYGMGPGMMGPGMYGGMGQGMMGPGNYGMMGPGMMMGYGFDARLDYLKGQLAITDAQTAAWDEYVKALKGRFEAMNAMHNAMFSAWQKGTPEARLDARINGMEAMLQSLKAQKPVLEALYKGLSDEQKKKANYMLGFGGRMM